MISCYLEMHFPLPCDKIYPLDQTDGCFNEGRKEPSRLSCYQSTVQFVTLACRNLLRLLKFVVASIQFHTLYILSNNRPVLIQKKHSFISNGLLSLINEATRTTTHELWISSENTQLVFLKLFGFFIDIKIKKVSVAVFIIP